MFHTELATLLMPPDSVFRMPAHLSEPISGITRNGAPPEGPYASTPEASEPLAARCFSRYMR